MKQISLVVHLTFSEDVPEQDKEPIAFNVQNSLLRARNDSGLAPDGSRYYTEKVEVQELPETKQKPEIFIFVSGGNIQGISATEQMEVTLYDKDNADVDEQYIDDNGTEDDWDKMIKEKTDKGEIVGIY